MNKYIIVYFLFLTLFTNSQSNAQTVYSGLAQQYANNGNYRDAIRLEKEGIDVLVRIKGGENQEHIESLMNLSQYYASAGDMNQALFNLKEAFNLANEILDPKDALYGTILYLLSSFNWAMGYYSEANKYCRYGLKLAEQFHGKYHEDYLLFLWCVANLRSAEGRYLESVKLGEEALEISKKLYGPNHLNYAKSLDNLANFNAYLGNYSKAIRYGLDVLEIRTSCLGIKHTDTIKTLINLIGYFCQTGNYNEALSYGIRVSRIISFNDSPLEYIHFLNNLAACNAYINNYTEAIKLASEALGLYRDFNIESPQYASLLDNLGIYYLNYGDSTRALENLLESLELRERLLEPNHIDLATSWMHLADFYYREGKYQKAIEWGEKAQTLKRKILGENHPLYADALVGLFLYNFLLENYTHSTNLLRNALSIKQEILGEGHPESIEILGLLIADYIFNKDYIRMSEKMKSYSSIIREHITNTFMGLTLSERNQYWNFLRNNFIIYQIGLFNFNDCDLISGAYNLSLFSKGILLNSEIEFGKFLAEAGSPELAEKYNEIKSLRLQLNRLYEKPIAERWCNTDSLERVAMNLERELMYESKEFGDYTRNLAITWEDVRDNLKEKEAAIEFVSFPLNNDSTMYMAYVLRPDMEVPELVKFFEEKDLTSLIDEDDKASIYTNRSASELIWGKLQPQLEGVENVYFAPDGVLHQIAIEYLPDMDGEGMISDRFNLHRLSSTREIALNRHSAPTKEVVVYGGIKYDTDVATMETESRKYERPKHRGFSPYYNLGDSLALRASLEYLDGSLTEAENINGMMKENNYNSTFLSGNDATEESFKNLSGKANGIIHISTHGFYWTESEAERKASLNDRLIFMSQLGDNARRNVEDKALTRTGLFMAGAKNALGGVEFPHDVDDGILTAQEIANLDLRGLDLVVLSACQTGMGDISGDGVFGLQRGFKKAGANTILMSLWDVSDEATQILMTNFYKNYLGGMSKQQALREAQKTVRETPGFSDPEYWAAFILLDALN